MTPQFDMAQLLAQAGALQKRLEEAKALLAQRKVQGQSGGGLVTVIANGALEIEAIKLDPICVDNRDVKMLEDLIVAATNLALREAQALAQRELDPSSMLAGLGRP